MKKWLLINISVLVFIATDNKMMLFVSAPFCLISCMFRFIIFCRVSLLWNESKQSQTNPHLFYMWSSVIIALRSVNKPWNGRWWIHISSNSCWICSGGGAAGGESVAFVAPLSLSNWVKVDVPLSEPLANCSGRENKLFSVWFDCAALWLVSG